MITVNPRSLPQIDYRALVPFQKNLKDLDDKNYQRILRSFKKHGFFVPAFIWFDGDTPRILDMHQRHRVLMAEQVVFENSGYEIPYIEIRAENELDAKEKLLLISSQYGHITQEGIDEFGHDLNLNDIDFHFDALIDFKPLLPEPEPPDNPEPPSLVTGIHCDTCRCHDE